MKTRESKEVFDSLVHNGIDFLKSSVEELTKRPKYSIINFCSAIEIFLKARLLLEHWSLIIENPIKASLASFINGDYRSVGIDGTIERLRNIAGLKISREAQIAFSRVQRHRNKLIHSFHPQYLKDPNDELIRDIVDEQLKAWFYLHIFLTKDCRNQFADYLDALKELHSLVRGEQGYLLAKFESLLPDIEKRKRRGIVFSSCRFCGLHSAKEGEPENHHISIECLVCEIKSSRIELICPTCGAIIEIHSLGQAETSVCRAHVDVDGLIDEYVGVKEDPLCELAYCSECEFTDRPSVINVNGDWVCFSCLEWKVLVEPCGWCGDYVTGVVGDYYSPGCFRCTFHIAQDSDVQNHT
ncbi:MAG TPA: hypothetical protein VN687_19510 [Blastocatellia bacterium]|nr:hypothetical protein [Blastocatellia bacterium]